MPCIRRPPGTARGPTPRARRRARRSSPTTRRVGSRPRKARSSRRPRRRSQASARRRALAWRARNPAWARTAPEAGRARARPTTGGGLRHVPATVSAPCGSGLTGGVRALPSCEQERALRVDKDVFPPASAHSARRAASGRPRRPPRQASGRNECAAAGASSQVFWPRVRRSRVLLRRAGRDVRAEGVAGRLARRGNEPYLVGGHGTRSMAWSPVGRLSPAMCIAFDAPTIRFFARQASGPPSLLGVTALVPVLGREVALPLGPPHRARTARGP